MKIGLVKNEYGWERILEQEKALWELVNFDRNFDIYSIIILNSNDLSNDELKKINKYVTLGGSILTDTLSFKNMNKNLKIKPIYIRKIGGNSSIFRNIGTIRIERNGFIINQKRTNFLIYSLKYGKGFVIVLPFDLNLLMLDERHEKIYFPSSYAYPKENASLVSKGDLRRLIVNCFHQLYFARGLPYIHIWYYPKEYESVFCYRIDLDVFNKEEINNITKVIKDNENIRFTWFLSVINNKDYEQGIIDLYNTDQDIQSHSYEHLVYDSPEKDYENILRSNEFILKICKNPVGFAAPFGYWNKNLGLSLEKLKYSYSSEFSLGYDDMPFYPYLNYKKSNVIQLPIYPICIGSLIMRLYSKNKIKSYFNYLINMQYLKQMPLFLYDHPNDGIGRRPEVLEFIIKKIKSLDNVLITNLTDFSKWWKKREKIKFDISLDRNNIKLNTNNKNKDFYIRIVFPGYKETKILLKNQKINLLSLTKKQMPNFKSKNINLFGILKSKSLFSIFYLNILVNSIKRKIMYYATKLRYK